mgnify:CR=1 FL=1
MRELMGSSWGAHGELMGSLWGALTQHDSLTANQKTAETTSGILHTTPVSMHQHQRSSATLSRIFVSILQATHHTWHQASKTNQPTFPTAMAMSAKLIA